MMYFPENGASVASMLRKYSTTSSLKRVSWIVATAYADIATPRSTKTIFIAHDRCEPCVALRIPDQGKYMGNRKDTDVLSKSTMPYSSLVLKGLRVSVGKSL